MGKNLRGRELGKGLSQRKDGKYSARFISVTGKRVERYFDGLHEAERWLAEAREADNKNGLGISSDITYSEWFEYWLTNIKGKTIRYNTQRNYRERFEVNIKPVIGRMRLCDIRPLNCQQVLIGWKSNMLVLPCTKHFLLCTRLSIAQ